MSLLLWRTGLLHSLLLLISWWHNFFDKRLPKINPIAPHKHLCEMAINLCQFLPLLCTVLPTIKAV